jgi:hypothetical protein
VIAIARHWLAGRTERERRLVAAAATLLALVAIASLLVAVHDDLARLRARVGGHERELAQVRRLAATLGTAPVAPDGGTLLTRVQTATDAAGLAERVAAMTPGPTSGRPDDREGSLSVRVTGASLADTVRLLHELDADATGPAVSRLGLRKHPDDPRRFDLTLEVTAGRAR